MRIIKIITKATFVFFVAFAAYFLLWPTEIEPVAWDAPRDEGYTGPFTPNDRLAEIEVLPLGSTNGPEDVVALPLTDDKNSSAVRNNRCILKNMNIVRNIVSNGPLRGTC